MKTIATLVLCLFLTACSNATRTVPVPKIVIEDHGINAVEHPKLVLPPGPVEQYDLPPPK